jgi:hypothetical protein
MKFSFRGHREALCGVTGPNLQTMPGRTPPERLPGKLQCDRFLQTNDWASLMVVLHLAPC